MSCCRGLTESAGDALFVGPGDRLHVATMVGCPEPLSLSQSQYEARALKATAAKLDVVNTPSRSERETRRAHKRMPMGRHVRCQVGPDGSRIQARWGVRHALPQLTQAGFVAKHLVRAAA